MSASGERLKSGLLNGSGAARTLWLLGALIGFYLLLPLVGLFVHLAQTPSAGFHAPGLISALFTSLGASAMATAIIGVCGIPLAYLLARSHTKVAKVVGICVQLPLAIPPLVAGILLLWVLGPTTPVGRLFHGSLTNTEVGIVCAQIFVAAPFLIVASRSAFAAILSSYDEVGRTLDLSTWERFAKIALPLAAPGIRAGLLLTFLRSMGEFGANIILAYHPYSLPVFTFVQFTQSGISTALAPAILAIGVALVVLGVSQIELPRKRTALPEITPVPFRFRGASSLSFSLSQHLGNFALDVDYVGPPRLSVLGTSGAGKTTLLRALGGLAAASTRFSHRLELEDHILDTRSTWRIGYVPQFPSLLPHKSVFSQVTLSPRSNDAQALGALVAVGIEALGDRYPDELSGGQAQRVALARALASNPDLLLLDEPFSALDTPTREELARLLRRICLEQGIACVVVTHDPVEAALLGEGIMVLTGGKSVQVGTRRELFDAPHSVEIARLLGIANVFLGEQHDGEVHCGPWRFPFEGARHAGHVLIAINERRIALTTEKDQDGERGIVTDLIDLGTYSEMIVTFTTKLALRVKGDHVNAPPVGESVGVLLENDAVSIWSATDASANLEQGVPR